MADLLHFLWGNIVVFLAVLTVVVFVHELGHYLVARACGVKIETFSIGFGPELIGRTAKSGTRWRISLLPLGGYVKMFGDADAASTPGETSHLTPEEQAQTLAGRPVWQRAAVVAAGPLFNLVFGLFLMAAGYWFAGEVRLAPVVGKVSEGSAAEQAGIKTGDRILQANAHSVDRFQDVQTVVGLSVGEPVALVIQRDGQQLMFSVQPRIIEMDDGFGNKIKRPLLGISSDPDASEIIHHGPISAMGSALRDGTGMISATLTGVGQMLSGRRSTEDLSGPIGIAKRTGQAAQFGTGGVIYIIILLSINLGLVNLFPVPMLDGGHLVFYAAEALIGRPLSPKVQEYGFRVGLFLVIALMLLATRNDLVALFRAH